ncbi:MAG: saccharopine dehydrogenase C-terminal domain-containing protein, partial [Nitrososphaerales archaeon]
MTQGKNVIVLGSGLMGSSIALDLVSSNSVATLAVADSNPERLKLLKQRVSSKGAEYAKKLETLQFDITKDAEALKNLLSRFDLGVGALPHGIAERAVLGAIESKVDFVDLIFSWRYEEGSDVDSKAKKNGVTIIPACGLAPGLTNILAKYGADQLEEVDYVKISVGGIPEVPKPPLNYRIVFAVDSVLEEYMRDAVIVRDGKKIIIPALSGLEEMKFSEFPDQKFEAFITDGLSTLPETLKKVKNMEEKTIRWKGHAEDIALLIDLGLFSERPINLGRSGSRIAPRTLLSTLLEKKLGMHQGDKDMTLLRVQIKGRKRKGDKTMRTHEYEMVDRYDSSTQTTSMARTTAYPCSIVAQMLIEGKITETGFIPPELAIRDDRFDEYI